MTDAATSDSMADQVAIKRVTFLSRLKAQAMVPKVPSMLISIHDISEPEARVQDGWKGVLYLRFHDTDGTLLGLEQYTQDHAARSLAFVMQHGGLCEHLVVHCHAGESRSAGLALMLSEALGVPCFKEYLPVDVGGYKAYNRQVHSRTWREAMNDPDDRFLVWSGYV